MPATLQLLRIAGLSRAPISGRFNAQLMQPQPPPDEPDDNDVKTSRKRGFALMDPNRQREIASMGGKAAHKQGTAHEFDSEEARKAGVKSQRNRRESRQAPDNVRWCFGQARTRRVVQAEHRNGVVPRKVDAKKPTPCGMGSVSLRGTRD
jgi:general stress protein YciG